VSGAPPGLRVTDLALRFGDAPGFAGLSCEVAAGARLVIVGASGAGKTTLLRAVAGLAPVDAGRVEVGGRDVTRLPPERRDAVYLHQTPVLFPHLSVFENVAFPLRVRRAAEPLVRERVGAALDTVRMVGFEARAPRTLSGGQRHRVALARAIAARPALLLLDEPLSALDPALRDDVRDAILAAQGAPPPPGAAAPALVVVTHDFDEAALLGDEIAVLVDRRIAQVAPPSVLFRRPASLAVARFLGVPNEVAGTVDGRGLFHSPLGALAAGPDAPPAGAAVGVCPVEALRAVAPHAAPPDAPRARVVAVRHRAHRTTVLLRAAGAELEAPADPVDPPAVGSELAVLVDARQLVLFAGAG
jgi:ABC-type Fe3+/spermidine/putrescine transport system ATPase subunit